MKADFDFIRTQLANATNNLVDFYNKSKDKEIDIERLHRRIDDLRNITGLILCLESSGGDIFKASNDDLIDLED